MRKLLIGSLALCLVYLSGLPLSHAGGNGIAYSVEFSKSISPERLSSSDEGLPDVPEQPLVAGIFEQDYNALVALYNATNGTNWTNNTGWLQEGLDVKDWYGVTVSQSRVTEISLLSNKLSGAIPAEIGNLTSLTYLLLSGNSLTGNLPEEIWALTSLRTLWLQNNNLYGTIPAEVGNFISLFSLQLGGNNFTGSVPKEIGALTELNYLSLQDNQLSGSIPAEIGNLTSLIQLLVGHNGITGSLPKEIGALTNLQTLWLLDNQLSGTIPAEIGNLTSLTQLLLSDNTFTGSLPSELGNLQSLSSLQLDNNSFSGSIPMSLTNLDNLTTFRYVGTNLCEPQDQAWLDWKTGRNITGNGISCTATDIHAFRMEGIDAYIDPLSFNVALNLPGADISSLVAEFVVSTGATVSLGGVTQISGVTSNDFSQQPLVYTITSEDGLQSVDWTVTVTNQPIVAGIFEQDYNALVALYNATNGANWTDNTGWLQEGVGAKDWYGVSVVNNRVSFLVLVNNNLSGEIPGEIGNLSALLSLSLWSNELSGTIPEEVGRLNDLKFLHLWSNQLSGPIPGEIGNLSSLIQLNLSSNQLSGSIPTEIGNLSALQELSLSFNQLTGTIPAEMGNMGSLRTLIIRYTQLSGSLPVELTSLSNLESLWLHNNRLSGTIPAEIGNLTSLAQLLLSDNNLTGNIPQEIGTLSNLQSLVLQNNQLSGTIPAEIGNLLNLHSLELSGNPLTGPIPLSLTNLDNLAAGSRYFRYTGTNLCEPETQEWLDWKTGRNITGNGVTCSSTYLQSFSLGGVAADIDPASFTVYLNLPGVDISDLVAEFVVAAGASVGIDAVDQVSGVTANDFSQPLTYTITSEDGQQTANWTVTITNQPEVAGIFEQDYDALVALYNTTNGSNWINKAGWLEEGVGAKDWQGISVNQNRVVSISLVDNNLTGKLPIEIGDLLNLNALNLDNNPLTGLIPLSLTNMQDLATDSNALSFAGTYLCEPQDQEWLDWKAGRNITGNEVICTSTDLYAFRLEGVDADIDAANSTIFLSLPGKEINALSAEFVVFPGAVVSVAGVPQVSGITTNDFTQPITYSITSEDGQQTVEWLVNVTDQSIVAGIYEQDYNALVALYNATNGTNWTNNTGWLQEGLDVKDWYGVTVSESRVTHLYLLGNALSGTIPTEIGSLTAIKVLQLSFNQLSGTIPAVIELLGTLQELNLSNNQLSGAIPVGIGNLSALQYLYFNNNLLTGAVPAEIGTLDALQALQLSFNQLSGAIPPEAGSLSSLQELNLSYNQLSGNIPVEIGNLNALQSLSLHGNQLSGTIPAEIGDLSALQTLYLNNNRLSGDIPAGIWGLGTLQYLSLYDNQLTGAIPAEIGSLTEMISLLLGSNQLSGTIPAEIGAITNLQSLWLQGNLFSGNVPVEIGNLTNLTELQLGNNGFTGSLPTELGNLQNLRILNVYSNPLTGLIPQSLTNLAELGGISGSFSYNATYLCEPQNQDWLDWKTGRNITGNNLVCSPTDLYVFRIEGVDASIDPANFSISLNLPGSDISAIAAEFVVAAGASVSIGEVPQVSGVTVNDFSQPLTYSITSQDGLESVEWTVNITNQSIVAGVFEQDYNALVALYNATDGANWTNKTGWLQEGVEVANWYGVAVSQNRVTYVYSANNNLSGVIPAEIGNLTGLQYLDFNNNHLTGAIPEEVGDLSTLTSLLLGNNELSGTIPEEIGGLSDLEYLDLQGNQLTGAIPVEIGNLGSLLQLNLAFNQLSGTIPAEIGNLSSLQLLTCSVNQLSGPIPAEIGNLSNLQNLWLASNQLTGSIPQEVGNLTNLTQLLLDGNSLTGSLPSELGNLQNIRNLNLNNNSLVGAIPQSLTDLEYLAIESNSFSYSGTSLCEPQNQAWLDWKAVRNITGNDLVCTPTDLYVFKLEGMDANIDPENFTISLNLPGADISTLAAEFVVATGASVSIGEVSQVSGVTLNDFSEPLTYMITSEDGQQSVDWVVNITNQPIVAGIFEQDYNALVALYNATNGADWNYKTGWLEEGINAKDWFGVSVSQNRVTNISLAGNNLTGAIPTEIGQLSELQYLSLSANQLSGPIAPEIGNLSDLQYLYLSGNQLSGTIPEGIGSLTDLLHLYLSNNQLSGPIPAEIGNLSSLLILQLGFNQLSGAIPAEIGNLAALQNLWLAHNDLANTIPAEVGNLSNLKQLLVEGNNLTGSLPSELGNLHELRSLNLFNNTLVGAIPLSLANLNYLGNGGYFNYSSTNLCEPQNQEWLDWKAGRNITGNGAICSSIDLYSFRIEGIDAEIDQTNFTVTLNLPGTDISALVAEFLVFPGALVVVGGVSQVSGTTANDFSEPLTYTITSENGQQSVEWLVNITNQPIVAGIIEQDYDALVALYNATDGANWTNKTGWLEEGVDAGEWHGISVSDNRVVTISLAGNGLSGTIPHEIGNISKLQSLSLSSNQLSGTIPSEIGNLSDLKYLYLSSNQISGAIPFEIGNLAALKNLNLSGNELTGSIPTEISNLTSLTQILLSHNNLTGSLPGEIGALANLQTLWLTDNQLSGSIPAEIGNLTNLYGLLLGSNNLTGSLPKEIGALTNLENLWIGSNQLSGTIPAEIGNLTSLTQLLLDYNDLTGSLPKEIGALTNLETLSLQGNQLSGTIPAEIGALASLIDLMLNSNNLSGSLPPEMGNLQNLGSLNLNDNPLSGPMPQALTDLDYLANEFNFFSYTGTNLCEPQNQEWLDWKAGRNITGNGIICNTEGLLTFSLPGQSSLTTNEASGTIAALVEAGTDISNLVASFTLGQGANAYVNDLVQVSGTTANDFRQPVTYTVIAEDGITTKEWAVSVVIEQSITFEALAAKTFGEEAFALAATASSGLVVSYASSKEEVATVSGNTVTIKGAGETTITASQPGNGNYAAATSVAQLLTVNKASQSITFGALPAKAFGAEPFALAATASSGLTVTYSSSNEQVATISGNTVTIIGAGETSITASQPGNGNHTAATSIPQLLTVNKASQSLTFEALPAKTFGEEAFALTATASSGLVVTYSSSNEAVATISGNTVTIKGAGETTITASQPGNANYSAATSVAQLLTVSKASQTIIFEALPAKTLGDVPFDLTATASSGLTVTYSSSNEQVATINGSTVTMKGAGETSITASQPGNDNFLAAQPVVQTFVVTTEQVDSRKGQVISFQLPATLYVDKGPVVLSGQSDSGLPVAYEIKSGLASLSDNMVTFDGPGEISIVASQGGNDEFKPAQPVTATMTVRSLMNISGKVVAQNGATVSGLVQAIRHVSDGGVGSEAALVDGAFLLTGLKDGDYLIKYIPNELSASQYFPTYFVSSLFWQQAQTVTLSNTDVSSLELSAILKSQTPPQQGNGRIRGRVVVAENAGSSRIVVGRLYEGGSPLENIAVYLLKSGEQAIFSEALTNAEGDFEMTGLPGGQYELLLDVPGIAMAPGSSVIDLDESKPIELTAFVGEDGIVTEVSVVASVSLEEALQINIYPNPVSEYLVLDYQHSDLNSERMSIRLYSILGQELMADKIAVGKTLLDLRGYSPGMLLLTIFDEAGNLINQIKIKKE